MSGTGFRLLCGHYNIFSDRYNMNSLFYYTSGYKCNFCKFASKDDLNQEI